MSGYLRTGPHLSSPTYTAAQGPQGQPGAGAPHSSQAFAAALTGSPAPAPASPQAALQQASRSAPLIPLATQLSVAPGDHFAGRVLAALDVSIGGWPQVTERTVQPVAAAAPADRVVAICPPDRMNPRAPAWV